MGHDPKFMWIEHERHFMFHHLRESLNPWMTIFPIFCGFEWKLETILCGFMWDCKNYRNWAWTGFHNVELKWNVILWNAKHCFLAWTSIHQLITSYNSWNNHFWPLVGTAKMCFMIVFLFTFLSAVCKDRPKWTCTSQTQITSFEKAILDLGHTL